LDRILRQGVNGLCFLGIALLGCALSLGLYQVWQLETRWAFVVIVGIAAVAVAMRLVRIFSDFLLITIFFALPFAAISTKFLGQPLLIKTYAGFFSASLLDFLLIGLYMGWFYRVFVTREQSPPGFDWLDFFVLWFIVAHLAATISGETQMIIGFGATEFVLKYGLFYFYLSRHLDERYLLWLLGAFAFIIVLDTCLGTFQFTTGRLVGLALDKGAGAALNSQGVIPGAEGFTRATGTSYDSHGFGHFMALLLPFPLVLLFTPGLRPAVRRGSAALAAGALLDILLSLSRSAWLAAAIALTIGILLMIVFWRERHMVPALAAGVVVVALVTPFIGAYVYQRFAQSPSGTLWERWYLMRIGWYVLTLNPVFGVGPGNSVIAMVRHGFLWLQQEFLHNVMLGIAVEIGIFGLIPYIAILAVASWRFFSLARRRRDIAGRLALASLIALMATVLNGVTDPSFREPNLFEMFWLLVALSAVLPRLPPGAFGVLMAPPQPVGGWVAAPAMVLGGGAGQDGK
jgi:putative inorganic carbon (hco3(-)) transporter